MKSVALLEKNFDLKPLNTFQISSVADNVYFPENEAEFVELLKTLENPVILGGGSNILFSSAGVKEPVISTRALDTIMLDGDIITAGTGAKTPVLAQFAAKHALSGFEFLAPIPASIGGAVCMNASAHGQAISDVFLSVKLFDLKKREIVEFSASQMNFGYRTSILKSGRYVKTSEQNKNEIFDSRASAIKGRSPYVFLEGKFKLSKALQDTIKARMEENVKYRKKHHPGLKFPNAGSIFKNPPDTSAGALIDQCGLKGTKMGGIDGVGGAQIFENHANFIVNTGGATSKDVTELMFLAYNKVMEKFGVGLTPEILFIGEKESEVLERMWEKMLENQVK